MAKKTTVCVHLSDAELASLDALCNHLEGASWSAAIRTAISLGLRVCSDAEKAEGKG